MKKKILTVSFALFALFATVFATDKGKTRGTETTREVIIHERFESILIGPNIKVVLVPRNTNNAVSIAGSRDLVDLVSVKISNNEMTISTKKNARDKNIVVYVPVDDLTYIELKEGASLSGEGMLKFNALTVLLNDDSHVNLKAIGSIEIESANNCELVFEKYENAKLITKAP